MPNSTGSVAERTELPVITAENFAECRAAFWDQPVPTEVVEAVRAANLKPRRAGRAMGIYEYQRDDFTENGEPTTWTVYIYDDGTEPRQDIAHYFFCDVEWCKDEHDINEAETWEGVWHHVKASTEGTVGGLVDVYNHENGFGLYFELDFTHEGTIDDAEQILNGLEEYASLIRAQVQRARELAAGVVA